MVVEVNILAFWMSGLLLSCAEQPSEIKSGEMAVTLVKWVICASTGAP